METRLWPRLLVLLCATFGLGTLFAHGEKFGLPDASDPLAGMGVNIHFTDPRPGELEMLTRAGFRWVRMDFAWMATEKKAGVYDFSAYDRLLASLDKFHLRALLILDYGNGLYEKNAAAPHSDEARAAFARWAVAAVTHFKGRGVLWEIWNEPNGDWFWTPRVNPEDYAKLALVVNKAVHEAAPDELIAGPALSGIQLYFVDVLGREGVLGDWAALTIHPYLHGGPETYGPTYVRARDLLKKYTKPGQQIDLVCGESGFCSTWPGLNETKEAQFLPRLFLFDVLSGVPLTIWYDWHDDGADPVNQENSYGIVHFDYHPGRSEIYDHKPAYDAAQTYFHALEGYLLKERITLASENDYVLFFTKDGKPCMVAWTTAPNSHVVKIPMSDGIYMATSYDGKRQMAMAATGGVLVLTLEAGPQYLKPQ